MSLPKSDFINFRRLASVAAKQITLASTLAFRLISKEVKTMAGQFSLNHKQLQQFAPNSPILAFRPQDSGSPQQDWCAQLQAFPHYRRELEEFVVLGDVVVRIADGREPAPLEKVKILSLEYAVKTLENETDAKEFVRSVKAIASPDAGQYELEQIAAFYYGEIRRRGNANTSEILKEMGMLGVQMKAVTATVEEREIEFNEINLTEQQLTDADERRVKAARENLSPMPAPTPNFDAELAFIATRIGSSKITRAITNEYADFYLNGDGKTCEELDADFLSFERIEQYDENGIVGFSMSGESHAVVVYDFFAEVTADYLPAYTHSLAREINLIFVGHALGGAAAQRARQFTFAHRVSQNELNKLRKSFCSAAIPAVAIPIPPPEKFSAFPFSETEFVDWLAAKLDLFYPRRVLRNARRLTTSKAGFPVEFMTTVEVNPDFDEMQYVAAVCQILWTNLNADFHLRSMRRETYQQLHTQIRKCEDTADVASLKKEAYNLFKEQKKLSLKEFTAINTVAKSQEARLADKTSATTRKTLADIFLASANRVAFLKFFLYNDAVIQTLTRQEKQLLWSAIRARETVIQTDKNNSGRQTANAVQTQRVRQSNTRKQVVRVTPRVV